MASIKETCRGKVGSRLDLEPAQLFKLRGVNHEELIDVKAVIIDVTKAGTTKGRHLVAPQLSQIFDIDFIGKQRP